MKKQTYNRIYEYLKRKENNENINIARIISDKQYHVAHYLLKVDEPKVVFAILSDDNELLLVTKAQTNYLGSSKKNGRTQIDGETEININIDTEKSANIITGLLNDFVFLDVKDKQDILSNFISNVKYYQHNVDNEIGDGLEELKRSIKHMQENDSDFHYDKLNIMVAQNNFVFIHSEQYWHNPKTNMVETWKYFDLFRIEGSKIIEHWDIIKHEK